MRRRRDELSRFAVSLDTSLATLPARAAADRYAQRAYEHNAGKNRVQATPPLICKGTLGRRFGVLLLERFC